ncbi:unnamed protein product [Tuber aestivum]|uniref:Uncharacterized protein n=1 Tax=Tuber aestivum TaxID=59557 RepID=A0A292Q8M9_9PEZI|nr:unnamed protein product [Tuber aestivum]
MFCNWATVASTPIRGLDGSLHSGQTIKPPVPFSGPKTFPRYSSPQTSNSSFTAPPQERSFYSFFGRIKKATEVTPEHLNALGVLVEYDVPVERLLPGDGAGFIPADDDKIFSERRRELLIPNDDAVEALARKRKDIKLGHMYRFYQGVDLVRAYYPTEPPSDPLTPMSSGDEAGKGGKRKAEEVVEGGVEKRGKPEERSATAANPPSEPPKTGEDEDDGRFAMPEKFREEIVKNFIEPICWGYGVRIYPPRALPRVALQRSRFLVHMTNYIYLTPALPAEARSGLVEGPVMGVQVRHESEFLKKLSNDSMDVDGEEEVGDVIGITREVAAALSLAQDRRKGPKEGKPEGKTEKKVRFRAVGKDDKWRDDIFLLTSLHHHVSISRISVTQPYLRFLETGQMPNLNHEYFRTEEGNDWDKLKVQKTRFWDLLDPEERAEAGRNISGVLAWLSRNEPKRLVIAFTFGWCVGLAWEEEDPCVCRLVDGHEDMGIWMAIL